MYLVDTNVVSEIRKKERANKGVRAFFRRAVKENRDLYVSVVTVGELRRGVEIIRHRGDVAQTGILDAWLTAILDEFAQNILPVDEDIGQLWGRLRVPHAEHALDKLIAATALIHDLIVVTRNVDDFSSTGVRLLNPFI
ncbi:type II toxin-antitoxin system VapC family toxin [Burkholderia sp. L27(2015)]|uniref:type II toxin-antitoxin system VapC family toxin n=1 Tax=Burkholderia sp. L27(2015) TaxID=1641858 RepID=UPI00131DE113|nr:type II toxin-antitoxin system VapC family toxin [Burkholderia sp. L27(2015)]